MFAPLACSLASLCLPVGCRYAFAQSVALFGVVHPQYKDTAAGVTVFQVIWLVLFVVSTTYTYSWDVTQDWGLAKPDADAGWRLRDRTMFAHT